MKFLCQIQKTLEDNYGAHTGLDIRDFVKETKELKELGTLLVEQEVHSPDLNIALLLDRDILQAFEGGGDLEKRTVSVSFEEVSHFVYLCFNHNRGRNITALEMEVQSEVDRIVLAFNEKLKLGNFHKESLLEELFNEPYKNKRYEEARLMASKFLRQLSGGNPLAWTKKEEERLRQFFHSDLGEKFRLAG